MSGFRDVLTVGLQSYRSSVGASGIMKPPAVEASTSKPRAPDNLGLGLESKYIYIYIYIYLSLSLSLSIYLSIYLSS